MVRIAIIDDHKVVADALAQAIEEAEGIHVIGKAYSAAGCWQLLDSEQPNVLLLDINLPDGNGIALCTKIKEKYPQVKILMLTSYGELATINRALDAGANGYVIKNSATEELLAGIMAVMSGKRFLCEEAGVALQSNEQNSLELTRRELELLQLIVEGYTLPEQVDKMCLGANTIRSYRQNLNVKLNAHNTAQLVQNAKALGLV